MTTLAWRRFNPRTPAGCDVRYRYVMSSGFVSIHAPLRGATSDGAGLMYAANGFNPRTPAGCDGHLERHVQDGGVSIHAPLRGATYC